MSLGGSLYLLKEAGALLAGGAMAGAFTGAGASPPFMPRLPWQYADRNTPAPIPTPPIMTRIPGGTPPPPSAYSGQGEAGALDDSSPFNGWIDEAGSAVPSGSGFTQAQWDALSPTMQAAVLRELGARVATSPTPSTNAPIYTTSTQAPAPFSCPPGYVDLGGGEFPHNCQPAHMMTPPPAAPPPTPAPPIMRTMSFTPGPPADVAPPPPALQGGGAGASTPVPWVPLLGVGAVLAFLYAGRKKRGRR